MVVSTAVAPAELTDRAIGVDLGISRVAVSSDNRFFGGKTKKEINNRYFRLRRALQAKGHPQAGTRSAKRHLKKLSGRLARFQTDVNHCVSKQLAAGCVPGDTLAMEDLTHIRERVRGRRQQRRAMSNWSFRQLQGFIRYKALAVGVRIKFVDARYSSQGCSCCGVVNKHSRKNQSKFACKHCGFQLNADLNASRNLASLACGVAGRVQSITLSSQHSVS